MKLRREKDLAAQPGVLVENTVALVPLEYVLLIIRRFWKLLKPFLSNVNLALGGASLDLLQAMGGGVDEFVIC